MNLLAPKELSLKKTTNPSSEWKRFRQDWENFEIASDTCAKSDKVRVATFLNLAGRDAVEVYNTFSWDNDDDKHLIANVVDKFQAHCSEKTNVIAERYVFLNRKQKPDETIDDFTTDLKNLCLSCEYTNPNEMLRDQFVLQIYDDGAREKLLDQAQSNASTLTFEKAVSLVKNYETTKRQKISMIKKEETLYKVKNKFTKSNKCRKCGFIHAFGDCRAYGKTCYKCSGKNHFASMCHAKATQATVNLAEETADQESEDMETDNII